MSKDPSRWRTAASRHHWVIALGLYILLTLVFTFPIIFHLGDRVLGPTSQGDSLASIWFVWWFRTAILSGQDPAYTHLIYALVPQIQIFVPTAFNGIVGGILLFVMTPTSMYNVLVLLGFPLSGLTMYLLAHEFVQSRFACFVSGFLFTFCTYHFMRAGGQLTLATLEWLPFVVWRVIALYRRPSRANAVLMGLSLALVPLTDFYATAYFLVPFIVLFVAWLLLTDRGWLGNLHHILLVGLGIAVAAAIAVPLLYSSFRTDPSLQSAINNYATTGTEKYSSDVLAYVLPSPSNPWLGWIGVRTYGLMTSGASIEQSNYLGWVTILLGLGAFFFARNRSRMTAFWLALAVFGGLISLGPVVHVAGHAFYRVPNVAYDLLYRLPMLSNFRAPNRAGPTVILPVALLAAYCLDALFARMGGLDARISPLAFKKVAGTDYSRLLIGGFCVLAMGMSLFENMQFAFPYPSADLHVPSVYYEMARDPVPGLVLALPIYPRGSDEYYQIIHHRGLVDGYPIRVSLPMVLSIEDVPYLSYFDPVDDAVARDPTAPADVGFGDVYPILVTFKQGLEERGIRYVVFTTQDPRFVQPWMRTILLQELGSPVYDNASEHLTVWRLDPTAAVRGTYAYSMGSGWLPGLEATTYHKRIRSIQQDGQLIINAPHAGPLRVTLTAFAQLLPRTLVVTLNGQQVLTHRFAKAFVVERVDFGDLPLKKGTNVVQMHSDQGCTVPAQLTPTSSSDLRCFSFSVLQIATETH